MKNKPNNFVINTASSSKEEIKPMKPGNLPIDSFQSSELMQMRSQD